jgi:hypothetical protein
MERSRRLQPFLGTPMTEPELDAWADDSVNLFFNGCRFWTPSLLG